MRLPARMVAGLIAGTFLGVLALWMAVGYLTGPLPAMSPTLAVVGGLGLVVAPVANVALVTGCIMALAGRLEGLPVARYALLVLLVWDAVRTLLWFSLSGSLAHGWPVEPALAWEAHVVTSTAIGDMLQCVVLLALLRPAAQPVLEE